jgi:hypothetical protein
MDVFVKDHEWEFVWVGLLTMEMFCTLEQTCMLNMILVVVVRTLVELLLERIVKQCAASLLPQRH